MLCLNCTGAGTAPATFLLLPAKLHFALIDPYPLGLRAKRGENYGYTIFEYAMPELHRRWDSGGYQKGIGAR